MNIAFYCKNKNISKVDCSNLLNGNPGIGGTFYAMLGVAYFLQQKTKASSNKYYVFAESIHNLPEEMDKFLVDDENELEKALVKFDIDIVVINKVGDTLDGIIEKVGLTKAKIIIWAHCFIPYFELLRYANYKNVAKIVAVSKEQLLTFCDHKAYKKATYIYNICNYNLPYPRTFEHRKNNVVYIGSIVPLKGAHLLTKVWSRIIKAVPDAQLFIIGGGNLYNQNAKLGKYGIAEYFYEKRLLKPILGESGEIISSVHFLGVMGNEKFDVLNESKVAIPNPSGLTETFGYTAIEAQLAGCLVTTKRCPGYIETVYAKENLYSNVDSLADSIIRLLNYKKFDSSDTIKYIKCKFSNESIILKWEQIFDDVKNNRASDNGELTSMLAMNKYKILNKKINDYIHIMPSLMFYEMLVGKIKYIVAKVIDIRTTIHKIYRRIILKQ